MNRVARIYPMYLLITLLTFALIMTNPNRYEVIPTGIAYQSFEEKAGILLLNLTMLKGFFNQYKFTGIGQGWSLTVEECFYLSAPFFMLIIRRNRWGLVLLPIVTLLFMAGLVLTLGHLKFHGLFENLSFALNYTFFGRCLEFFAGMALAVFVIQKQQQNPNSLMRRNSWLTLAGGSLIAFSLLIMASISEHETSRDTLIGVAFNNIALPVAIVVLLYGLLTERTWLRILLSTKFFDILGKSSYIFYLIHVGVINIFLRTYFFHNSVLQFFALNIISIVMYKLIESPLHRWLKTI